MGAGSDAVTFDNANPITVQGNVLVDGGDGPNYVSGTDLTVDKNLSVTNGTATAGLIQTHFMNLSVGGNVTIKSTGGDTSTSIQRNAAGASTIKGNLAVTNGAGTDSFFLDDTNVDKNVTINNGHGNGSSAGETLIFNNFNSAYRSVIGGNVTVTYLDGNTSANDTVLDTEVLGNATFNHGSGAFRTYFDGNVAHVPVIIHGNLSVLGTGANSVFVGFGYDHTGMLVGKKFTLTSGGGSAVSAIFFNLHVGGNMSLTLGNGGNTVTIDDSEFDGTFTMVSGAGADTLNLETMNGTNSSTEFKKAVKIDMGAGSDQINLFYGSSPPDAGQVLVFWSTAVLANDETVVTAVGSILYPNGGAIRFV
jgi:hypothetical protein